MLGALNDELFMTSYMKRRLLSVLLPYLAFLLWSAEAAPKPATRPNVLFIAVDDLNHWVGYLGRNPQTVTPNIDRLARRGVWFTRSYCAAPVCNPSRAALMSGLRPGATGVYDNGEDFAPVIPTDITLTTQFRKAGIEVWKTPEKGQKRRGWVGIFNRSNRLKTVTLTPVPDPFRHTQHWRTRQEGDAFQTTLLIRPGVRARQGLADDRPARGTRGRQGKLRGSARGTATDAC
jgi:hypothetical protein